MIANVRVPTALEYAREDTSSWLKWYRINNKPTDTADAYGHNVKVFNFLTRLRWEKVDQSSLEQRLTDQSGITWLELLALYELHGGAPQSEDAEPALQLASPHDESTKKEKETKR